MEPDNVIEYEPISDSLGSDNRIEEVFEEEPVVYPYLGTLWSDFSLFGISNEVKGGMNGMFRQTQRDKEPIITSMLGEAIRLCKEEGIENPSVLDLYCSDGYYTFLAKSLGAGKCVGVEIKKNRIHAAKVIGKRLGFDDVTFKVGDVTKVLLPKADIVLCLGGIYYSQTPWKVVKLAYDRARKFLILQSVFSRGVVSSSYKRKIEDGRVTFSRAWLDERVKAAGWNILGQEKNVLTKSLPHRGKRKGSVYYLVGK